MFNWEDHLDEFKDKGEGPFYTDYLYSVQESYPTIGLASCNWGEVEGSDIPYLIAHKGDLIEKFNKYYYFREIGSETESRWQWSVDVVFDKIKHKYDHFIAMYENNMIDELGRELSETYSLNRHSVNNGTSSNNGNVKSVFQDTPIQALIEQANYATNKTDNTSSATGTSRDEVTTTDDLTRVKNENDASVLEQVNKNVDIWRDITVKFIDEFKICFINELGRI